MKAVVLAGGYAKRLYPLTKYIPKPLLPIDGLPILDSIVDQISQVNEINEIIISTNTFFKNHFQYWLQGAPFKFQKKFCLVVEPTVAEENKLGAIKALQYLLDSKEFDHEDLLVIAGDNYFDFNISDFISFYHNHMTPVVAFYDIEDKDKIKGKYGIGILDSNNKIIDFQEKPLAPQSSLVSTACYIYPEHTSQYIQEYAIGGNDMDAPGQFIKWLCKKTDVYGYIVKGMWYDIGSLETYEYACENFKSKIMGI
jgi:glucose-1-phosphate thymidylyltransferase